MAKTSSGSESNVATINMMLIAEQLVFSISNTKNISTVNGSLPRKTLPPPHLIKMRLFVP